MQDCEEINQMIQQMEQSLNQKICYQQGLNGSGFGGSVSGNGGSGSGYGGSGVLKRKRRIIFAVACLKVVSFVVACFKIELLHKKGKGKTYKTNASN
jgi:hypothetical protein